MSEKKYSLLIFDWDGTLADSAKIIVDTMQAAIAGLQLPPRDDQTIRELIGLGMNDVLTSLYPELELAQLQQMLAGYRSQWQAAGMQEAPLFERALDAVKQLHDEGYRIAIATGKSRRGLDRSLKHHREIHALVHNSRCADETLSKPDPLMLKQLLEEEGLAAEQALMIGDTEFDLAMARSIGMPGVGVTCGVHHPERLLKAGAVALIESVAALPGWLRG